jgi:hypothetical protein
LLGSDLYNSVQQDSSSGGGAAGSDVGAWSQQKESSEENPSDDKFKIHVTFEESSSDSL